MQDRNITFGGNFGTAISTVGANNSDICGLQGDGTIGAIFHLNITAATGTGQTCVIKIQGQDPASQNFYDIPGAAFASKNATGTDALVIHPGITTVANQATSQVLPRVFRAVATIGGTTPSFTFTLSAHGLEA